jgi:hypothetical protein
MPPSPADPLALAIFADELLECVTTALDETGEATGNPGAPECRAVTPSAPAWDSCCEGQLTVNLNRIYTAERFPLQLVEAKKCGTMSYVLEYQITHLTCANLDCVCCEAQTAVSDRVMLARYAILRGLQCCFTSWLSLPNRPPGAFSEQIPLADGDCVGSLTTVLVGLGCNCKC